jgi:regulator of sigma E protease
MSLLTQSSVLNTVWSVIVALLVLLVMITIHEFGHYLAGKALGFKINEFAIGFGPKLFSKKSKKSGEVFSVRLLPLGGYCAFEGEDEEVDNPDAFDKKAPWRRIIVLIAGATMNYLLALVIILVSFTAYGQMYYQVKGVKEDEAYAVEYSLQKDDILCQAEGKDIYLVTDLMKALNGKNEGDEVAFTVVRDGEQREISVILRRDCQFENVNQTSKLWNALGVDIEARDDGNSYFMLTTANVRLSFGATIGHSFVYSFKIAGTIFTVLGQLLTGHLGVDSLGGPVTTVVTTSQMVLLGFQSFLEISAFIGVNLAVFNLLPIPALDGSKVVFCLIEWIFKKRVPKKIEAIIHAVGFVLILGFAILVDILQFV